MYTQQTRDIEPMLGQRWAAVVCVLNKEVMRMEHNIIISFNEFTILLSGQ